MGLNWEDFSPKIMRKVHLTQRTFTTQVTEVSLHGCLPCWLYILYTLFQFKPLSIMFWFKENRNWLWPWINRKTTFIFVNERCACMMPSVDLNTLVYLMLYFTSIHIFHLLFYMTTCSNYAVGLRSLVIVPGHYDLIIMWWRISQRGWP